MNTLQPTPGEIIEQAVFNALSITPQAIHSIRREVQLKLNRPVLMKTILDSLQRLEEQRAACETVLGWAKPIDELSPNFPGAAQ